MDFIEIYDVNGKNICRKEINDYDASINVSDLNTGIYSGKAYTSQLFIKE
ncbi:MAG: T9SS type A sorting domain-containing protein [Bacteroidales bacterium]|nr:T9SS type A sorting domain-containing protein [Bacteroidales bacterium]